MYLSTVDLHTLKPPNILQYGACYYDTLYIIYSTTKWSQRANERSGFDFFCRLFRPSTEKQNKTCFSFKLYPKRKEKGLLKPFELLS